MKKNMKMSLWMQDLKQALRDLRRHGWQAAVSAVGLAVGIVSLSFSLNWLWTDTNRDSFRPDYKDLYVVERTDSAGMWRSHWVWYGLGERIDSVLGGNAQVGLWRMPFQGGRVKIARADSLEQASYAQNLSASVATVRALGCRVLHGNLDEMEKSGDRFVLTESLARRLFGRTDVVGESVARFWGRENRTYTVGAVVEDCGRESNLYYDFIEPLWPSENEINNAGVMNFAILLRTVDAEQAERELSRIDLGDNGYRLVLTPLRMYHKMGGGKPFLEAYFYPLAFVVLSVLLVLSAVVNLVMAYTSIFLGRSREYALRRSLGASGGQNVGWMLSGVLPVVLLGLLLTALGMEWLRYGVGQSGVATGFYGVTAWVAGGVAVLCCLGMAYPVRKMRRGYRRSFLGQVGAENSHAWLLVVQCFACAFLLFLSLGMQRQLKGMMYSDLGFDRENILRLYTGWMTPEGADGTYAYASIFDDLPQEFRKEAGAGITDAIAMRSDIFNRVTTHYMGVIPEAVWLQHHWGEDEADAAKSVIYMEIPYRAMEFFHIRTEQGGTLKAEEEQPGKLQVLFNWAAMQECGLTHPGQAKLYTGMFIRHEYMAANGNSDFGHYFWQELQIQDVADIRLNDFHQQERPLMLVGVPENHECPFIEHDAVYVKYAPGRREDAEAAVRRVLERFGVPEEQVYLSTLDEYIAGNYKEETYYANLLTVLTAFSVVVTLLGVFSMLLYSLRLRRRSMAIRRVMGAEFRDIFVSNLRGYLLFVAVGCVLAYFSASLLMRKWMEYFYYGEAPGVGLMALIWAGMSAMVSLIVWWQVRRCMREKPVEVLAPES